MINLCTLFDSNYLTRGLALNDSLARVAPSYHLYVIAFDDNSYNYLVHAGIPNLTPISLKDFEDPELLAVKPSRSTAEYCWTCTPSVILYCLRKFGLPACTYIDADMIFYHDPRVLLDEMGERSILISEHRYTKEYAHSAATHGIYCIQFICFKQDENGMKALNWWRERCLEWCYARLEDGKFGDQKYLDDWTTRFEGVHVLQHPGEGVAPWNLQQYQFTDQGGEVFVKYLKTARVYPLIFFHFHGLRLYTDRMASCCGTLYDIDRNATETIYFPYLKKLSDTGRRLEDQGIGFNPTEAKQPAPRKGRVLADYIKALIVLSVQGKFSPFRLKNYNFSRHYHIYDLDRLNQ